MVHTQEEFLIPGVRVILWSAPRCMSSVFERSIRELKSVKVLYEPHQQAYYRGPERVTDSNHPTEAELNPTATFQAADEMLLQSYHGYEALFAKNHTYFIEGKYEQYMEGRFARFKHTFLIRHPRKSIPSYMRACKQCSFPAIPDKNGIEQLFDLFKTVQQSIDPNPVVVDADDLLMNPRSIMEQYCSAVGLPFEESMLSWTPGEVQDWMSFAHCQVWHRTAMMSSGFMKPEEMQPESDLPRDVETAIAKALPSYNIMHAYRIKPGHA